MKYEVLPDKTKACDLLVDDYVMVENMLQLAYHTHERPKSYKFHAVRDDERFEVFQRIE